MRLRGKTWLIMAIVFISTGTPALAQSVQFLPQVDGNLTLNSFLRTYLQAKDDRDEGASDQLSIGPSLQFYFKPLLKLKKITTCRRIFFRAAANRGQADAIGVTK